MNTIKKWLRGWLFWLCLVVIFAILVFVDIHFDLTDFGSLSLISLILASIFFIVFLVTRSNCESGIRRLLTVLILSGSLGILFLILSGLRIFYHFDFEFLVSIIRLLFFVSGTVLLLKLVWRKK